MPTFDATAQVLIAFWKLPVAAPGSAPPRMSPGFRLLMKSSSVPTTLLAISLDASEALACERMALAVSDELTSAYLVAFAAECRNDLDQLTCHPA